MRNGITSFLLVLISFQILPIREAGTLFYGNQLIEEICYSKDIDCNHAEEKEDLKKNDLYTYHTLHYLNFLCFSSNQNHPIEKNYLSRLADDTPTRPPLSQMI